MNLKKIIIIFTFLMIIILKTNINITKTNIINTFLFTKKKNNDFETYY